MFNGKVRDRNSLEDQQRDVERSLQKANRDNELERKRLVEEEEKIENEIRINTELGNSDICRILAKQLVDIRRQKARIFAANNKINTLIYQNRANSAHNATINSTLGTAPNHSSNVYGVLPSSNVTNLSTNVNQRLDMVNNVLKDMTIESDDEDDYTVDNYLNTGNKFNSRVKSTVTTDENMSTTSKEPNTTNTMDTPNTTNTMDTTNSTNTGNILKNTTRSAANITSNSPTTRQFRDRANRRLSQFNDKTRFSQI